MIDIILSKKIKKKLNLIKNKSSDYKIILITGASSGIGKSLACFYAQEGRVLLLCGRSKEKLNGTAQICESKGAEVVLYVTDLAVSQDSMALTEQMCYEYDIDLAIFAAGSGDIKSADDDIEDVKILYNLAQLNYMTPCLMANIVGHQMIKKHIKGHIVLIGSVAAFHSLPFATAYSSSKAGLVRFADAFRIAVKKWGINVTLISPGFIDTPMSQRLECDKPFLVRLDDATSQIVHAIDSNKKQLILPKIFYLLKWIDILSPSIIRDFILSRIKVKQN